METIYIETTVVSYLVANPSRDAILAAHQQVTRHWWRDERLRYKCVTSEEVLREAALGDTEMIRRRIGRNPCSCGVVKPSKHSSDLELPAPGESAFAATLAGVHGAAGADFAGDLHSD